jgi:hypothetical protein
MSRLFLLVLGFLVAGCFSPKVQSGGFTCQANDNPACPSGFQCVDGVCVDHPGGGPGGPADQAMSSMDDMTQPADLLMPADMSKPADMATLPQDMTKCLPFGHVCNSDPACCALCCAGGCAAVGNCALF